MQATVSFDPVRFGQFGCDFIDDTNQHAGLWGAIQYVDAAEMDVVEQDASVNGSPSTVVNIASLPAGTVLYGYFTEIALWSGRVIAYRRQQ
jgi:hypothetical protein